MTFYTSNKFKESVTSIVEQIKGRMDVFGFAVFPLDADKERGIPVGFFTVGFTKIGMPEFYVSGMSSYSDTGNNLVLKLRELYVLARDTGMVRTAQDLCFEINQDCVEDPKATVTTYRPVDATRMMYGQCTSLRYWAENEGYLDKVQGVQIVHRHDASVPFPVKSTPEQLLLDWVPYGSKAYTPQWEEVQNVATV